MTAVRDEANIRVTLKRENDGIIVSSLYIAMYFTNYLAIHCDDTAYCITVWSALIDTLLTRSAAVRAESVLVSAH